MQVHSTPTCRPTLLLRISICFPSESFLSSPLFRVFLAAFEPQTSLTRPAPTVNPPDLWLKPGRANQHALVPNFAAKQCFAASPAHKSRGGRLNIVDGLQFPSLSPSAVPRASRHRLLVALLQDPNSCLNLVPNCRRTLWSTNRTFLGDCLPQPCQY